MADGLVGWMPDQRRYASLHVVRADGCVASAGNGLLAVLAQLPGVAGAARLASRVAGARRLVDAAYWWAARNRHHLSRLVPDLPPVRR